MSKVTYIDEVDISNKRVLLRADFDVSLNPNYTIADDARIRKNLPTIEYLLKKNNRLICVAKLDRPKTRDPKLSLKVVVEKLREYLPNYKITLVEDFLNSDKSVFKNQKSNEILVLENIRFYPKEKDYSNLFAQELSKLADIYVNDAFAMCHRSDTSIIGPPKFLPACGGLLLKKEIQIIQQFIHNPERPIVAIIGGAKISSKIGLLNILTNIVDHLIIAGGMANTFLCAQGYSIGNSFCEYEEVQKARALLALPKFDRAFIFLPVDAIVADNPESQTSEVCKIENIPQDKSIFDLGPESLAEICTLIAKAKTIILNGPIGYFENPLFKRGTDFLYYSIANNMSAKSLVGGGDTLAAISKKEYLDKITHISTGGGAMLEFIEKGTLPGIEALKR